MGRQPYNSESHYSRIGNPVYEKPYTPKMLRPWPNSVNYGGENGYPDKYPYNVTHKPRNNEGFLRGASAAWLCSEFN